MQKNKQKKKSCRKPLNVKRNYKDRLFRLVFREKKDLLELYNAVHGTAYTDTEDLEVNTLEDVVYLSYKNDISFLVGGTMNLYEHQSSYNPNMPLRGLLYFSRLYEEYAQRSQLDLYSSTLQRLPSPRYFVFYNGVQEEPDRITLRLSDAFSDWEMREAPWLECVAVMLNINYGHNRQLMEKCRKLEEYALFIATVRRNMAMQTVKEEAVRSAVEECIRQNILRDLLVKQQAEVMSLILTSFNQELYEKNREREATERGWKAGLQQGMQQGLQQGLQKGMQQGIQQGLEQGAERISALIQKLISLKRGEEIDRVTRDPDYRDQLLKEFGL